MLKTFAWGTGFTLALAAGAVAQEAQPSGWYLEAFESSGVNDLFLYWHSSHGLSPEITSPE